MSGKIKRMIVGLTASLLLMLGAAPAIVSASNVEIQGSLCKGSGLDLSGNADTQSCQNQTGTTGTQANNYVARIINVFSIVVGIVSVLMIIYGGFRYVTSGGESNNISTAKNTILYAIIGLVIVALAQFIVKFVLAKATDVTQT